MNNIVFFVNCELCTVNIEKYCIFELRILATLLLTLLLTSSTPNGKLSKIRKNGLICYKFYVFVK
jgi:hypothetical protein